MNTAAVLAAYRKRQARMGRAKARPKMRGLAGEEVRRTVGGTGSLREHKARKMALRWGK